MVVYLVLLTRIFDFFTKTDETVMMDSLEALDSPEISVSLNDDIITYTGISPKSSTTHRLSIRIPSFDKLILCQKLTV